MRPLRFVLCALLVITGISCSRDPGIVKRKYVQIGNRYFAKGKYKEAYIMYRNALKKDPRYGEAYYRAGLTELRMGRPMDAARDFQRAADTDPNNTDASTQLGDIYLAGYLVNPRRPEPMRAEIDRISKQLLKQNPNSSEGLRLEGYLLLVAGRNPKAAIEVFQKANQLRPFTPKIVLPLAQSLIADGQLPEAEKLATGLIEKEKSFGPIYDLLYVVYMRGHRVADAESILKLKAANNPKQGDYLLQLARYYYIEQRPADVESVLAKLTADTNAFPGAHAKAGLFYRTIRNYDNAIRQYQAGMHADPKHKLDYEKAIAETLIAQGRRAEASKMLEDVLKENANDDQAQAMRASLLLDTGNVQQVETAINDLQSVVSRMPANPVLRFNYGRALLAKQQLDQARTQFQEAVKLAANYLPPRLALAEIQLARGEYGKALQSAREIIEINPGNLQAELISGSALARTGDLAGARAELTETLKQHPYSREAVLWIAALDLAEKHYREAEDIFRKLYQSNPGDPRGLEGLSDTYAAQGQFDKAAQLLTVELAKNPARSEIRLALGNVAFRAQKYDLAIEQYQALIQAHPSAGDLYIRLGEAYRLKENFQEAIHCFQKAKELRPNDPAAYLQLALLLEANGQRAQARPVYEQVLKLQPDNAVALNNLAYAMAETGGDLDQALTLAQRAKQKLPNDPDVADTLGWIYIKKNLSDNAVDIFRDLVAKQPNRSTYRYHLGMALFQKGDKPQAKKELTGALQKNPPKDEELRIRELIGKLG